MSFTDGSPLLVTLNVQARCSTDEVIEDADFNYYNKVYKTRKYNEYEYIHLMTNKRFRVL